MTVMTVPRTFISPRTYEGAPGRRVAGGGGRISRTISSSMPPIRSASRKSSSWRGAMSDAVSGSEAEEAKIVQRIRVHQQRLRLRNCSERSPQIGRKRRAELDGFAGDRMWEDQPCGMEEMPVLRQLDQPPSTASA